VLSHAYKHTEKYLSVPAKAKMGQTNITANVPCLPLRDSEGKSSSLGDAAGVICGDGRKPLEFCLVGVGGTSDDV